MNQPRHQLGTNQVPNDIVSSQLTIAKSPITDGEEEDEPDLMSLSVFIIPPRNKSVRRCRVRQMAPNLLSSFISQLETRQSAIRMNLKEAVAFVFSRDLDAR